MSSNINPNNIDTTYPIAGQDNDSQGFRDNFTNIKTNFQYAEDEISDLQTKVILKSALTGTTLDNNMDGAPISNATLNGCRTTRISLGNASTQTIPGTLPINYAAGEFHTFTLDYDSTLDFQNWPSAGNGSWVRVIVTVSSTSYTLTLPSAVSIGYQTIQGINLSTKKITFGQTGTYSFEFTTSNGGSTITVQDLSRNLDPIYLPSSEDLGNAAAASLFITTSYFTTGAAETATLAAGYPGQVKVFAMYGDGGNMVITVVNPAWGGAGTITFDTVGQACTLMYVNSKWFCIGNNGAVFA